MYSTNDRNGGILLQSKTLYSFMFIVFSLSLDNQLYNFYQGQKFLWKEQITVNFGCICVPIIRPSSANIRP